MHKSLLLQKRIKHFQNVFFYLLLTIRPHGWRWKTALPDFRVTLRKLVWCIHIRRATVSISAHSRRWKFWIMRGGALYQATAELSWAWVKLLSLIVTSKASSNLRTSIKLKNKKLSSSNFIPGVLLEFWYLSTSAKNVSAR